MWNDLNTESFTIFIPTYLIQLVFDAAGFQSQWIELILLNPFDDIYHLMVVLTTDFINLSKVNVVGNKALLKDATPQQR